MRLQKHFVPFQSPCVWRVKITPTFTSQVEVVTQISLDSKVLIHTATGSVSSPAPPAFSRHSTFSTVMREVSIFIFSKQGGKQAYMSKCSFVYMKGQNVDGVSWLLSLKWKHNKSAYWINGGESLGLRKRSNNKANLPQRCDANLFASPRRRLKKAPFIQSRMKRKEKRGDARYPSLSEQAQNFKWFQWLRYSGGGLH